jgi:hypothetical protein
LLLGDVGVEVERKEGRVQVAVGEHVEEGRGRAQVADGREAQALGSGQARWCMSAAISAPA